MKVRVVFFFFTVICLAGFIQGETLTNERVVQLVESKLSDDLIIALIKSSECTFKTDIDSVLGLKQKGVSDGVLKAMVDKGSGKLVAAPVAEGPVLERDSANSSKDPALPSEVGVFMLKDSELIEMEPEIVNWRTGGFLKKVATAGLTKGHVNGVVRGSNAKISLRGDEDILIYTMEGTSANEYQLLRLDAKDDRREFRAMTGGVIHASGGADKNAVYYEPKKVASRIYKFKLPELAPGEYGLLPPGLSSASVAAAGKIYAFTVGR